MLIALPLYHLAPLLGFTARGDGEATECRPRNCRVRRVIVTQTLPCYHTPTRSRQGTRQFGLSFLANMGNLAIKLP